MVVKGILPSLGLLFLFGCQLISGMPYRSTLEAIATREDQRVSVEEIFPYLGEKEEKPVRIRAALALARLRNAEAVDFIARCLDRERDSEVTEMLLFALGQIENPDASSAVLKFFSSSVATVRAAAVEAAGKLGDQGLMAPLLDRLQRDDSPLVRAESCLALYRLGSERYGRGQELPPDTATLRIEALLRAMLGDEHEDVRWRAAYALAGLPCADPKERRGIRDAFRTALEDEEDPWTRCFAARGLKNNPASPGVEQVAVKQALIKAIHAARPAGEWNFVVEAIEALGNYTDLETASELINYLLPGRLSNYHIRAAAARVLGRFTGEGEAISKALVRATSDSSRTVVGEAIVSLGALGDIKRLEETVEKGDRYIHLKAVEGAHKAGLSGAGVLLDLAKDMSIRVRCAALEALMDPIYLERADEIVPLAEQAISLKDMALRYTGARLLQTLGSRGSVELLKRAFLDSRDTEMAEARLKIVEAVSALGGPEDVDFFRRCVLDENFHIRDVAAKALATISGELIRVERETFSRQVVPEVGIDYFNNRPDPVACFQTTQGEFWIELFQDEAPAHVKNFISLAESGVYQKLTFHRVVSNFIVQGLDPRGDGWGFCGIKLRDEINRRKFLRGCVGMPHAGRDTGGCQIFITHCPTPHLDGDYTCFGRVISGMEVVDRLEEGDQVLKISVK